MSHELGGVAFNMGGEGVDSKDSTGQLGNETSVTRVSLLADKEPVMSRVTAQALGFEVANALGLDYPGQDKEKKRVPLPAEWTFN